jgi:hypothetical protein
MTSSTIGEANTTIWHDRRFQSRPRRKPMLAGEHELRISQTWCWSTPEALQCAGVTCLRCSQQVFRLALQLVEVRSLRERTSRVSNGIHGCLLHRLRPATRQRDCRWHQCDGLDSVLSAGPEAHPSAPSDLTPSHSGSYPNDAEPTPPDCPERLPVIVRRHVRAFALRRGLTALERITELTLCVGDDEQNAG